MNFIYLIKWPNFLRSLVESTSVTTKNKTLKKEVWSHHHSYYRKLWKKEQCLWKHIWGTRVGYT